MKYEPRIGQCYGMPVTPVKAGSTWIEGEMWCSDYGQFRRRGLVRHAITNELVKVRCDIPDTFFSIPATTNTEHGFVMGTDEPEFKFVPHTDQEGLTPAEYRKSVKKSYYRKSVTKVCK